ncbi:signal transduction histidine kinase [Rhizobium tibeticum]|uniref:sensor histidine kinase n=1 Tax=Rhizobium tibeticum TaxID=501024 RepID=UPI002781DBB7|nr:ATP-binding protein [Rhizobium tibeticum]MDP9810457.1 signal transduction histidine kinase [Rhizobium tibeticum]
MLDKFDVAASLFEIEADVVSALGPEVTLDVRITPTTPSVACCREGLRDAVIQFLANAREALPMGGAISLAAAARERGHATATLELRVVNNGPGMPYDMIRRASEPFFTTKTTGLGGLGLTIVSHFANEAGGSFRLESELGLGTRATCAGSLKRAA